MVVLGDQSELIFSFCAVYYEDLVDKEFGHSIQSDSCKSMRRIRPIQSSL